MNFCTPKYRLHKPTGQAVVTLNGKDFYLHAYGTPASRAEYDRLIAEWLANGRRLPQNAQDLTVNEMALAYQEFAKTYYRQPDGRPTNEYYDTKLSLRPLWTLYGHTMARSFGPLSLKAVRDEMIRSDLCRKEINKRIGRIVRAFKWAVENELIPPDVHHGLKAVSGLRRGRSDARESEPVKPVPEAFVDAIQTHVLPPVWAMIELQRLTGMRPGEAVQMRTCDLEMSGKVWVYRPATHKTSYRDRDRTISIGPRAQAILQPWLRVDLEAPLFSPREAVNAQNVLKRALRKSRVQPSQACRKKAQPRRVPQAMYSVDAFRRAIERGCVRANVPRWHPHQLRHNAATWLRKEFGLEVARCILGHRSAAVTECYAEMDFAKAAEVMAQVG